MKIKTVWVVVIEDRPRRWIFQDYGAAVASVKQSFPNMTYQFPPENQLTATTRLGFQMGHEWVQVDAVPCHLEPINIL